MKFTQGAGGRDPRDDSEKRGVLPPAAGAVRRGAEARYPGEPYANLEWIIEVFGGTSLKILQACGDENRRARCIVAAGPGRPGVNHRVAPAACRRFRWECSVVLSGGQVGGAAAPRRDGEIPARVRDLAGGRRLGLTAIRWRVPAMKQLTVFEAEAEARFRWGESPCARLCSLLAWNAQAFRSRNEATRIDQHPRAGNIVGGGLPRRRHPDEPGEPGETRRSRRKQQRCWRSTPPLFVIPLLRARPGRMPSRWSDHPSTRIRP